MELTASTALWFLPFAAPICLWVAWNDMKFMKIPNVLVLAMFGVFVVIGLIALPDWQTYAWRYLHLVVVLLVGFILNALGTLGAGDAKFAAAMAPFVALGDLMQFMIIMAAVLVITFFAHRVLRNVPYVRDKTPDWESWDNNDFPMGLALGSAMIAYLVMAVYGG